MSFESKVLDVMEYSIYYDTLYERLSEDMELTESDIYAILVFYYSSFAENKTLENCRTLWLKNRNDLASVPNNL